MQRIKFYRLRWLLLALVGVIIAFFLEKGFVAQFQYPRAYTNQIQKKLEGQLSQVDKDLLYLRQRIQSDGYFNPEQVGDFSPEYPVVIYLNGKLIYWSDQTFVPSYPEVAGNYQFFFREVARRESVLSRKTIEKGSLIYEIVGVVPLKVMEKTHVTYKGRTFNAKVFTNKRVDLSESFQFSNYRIFAPNKKFLFSVNFEKGYKREMGGVYVAIWVIIFASAFLYILFCWINAVHMARRSNFDRGLVFLIVSLIIGRLPLLWSRNFFGMDTMKIFNPKVFASSTLNPSLGDLILNLTFLSILVVYIFLFFHRSKLVRVLFRQPDSKRFPIGILLTAIAFESAFFVFNIFESINYHSQSSFAIGVSLLWDNFMVFSYLCVALSAFTFMLAQSVILKLFRKLFPERNSIPYLGIWFIGLLITLVNNDMMSGTGLAVVFTEIVMASSVLRLGLSKGTGKIKYTTVLFLFQGTIVVSLLGTISIQKYQTYNTESGRERFINNLNVENDIIGEYLLQRAGQEMAMDAFLGRLIQNKKRLRKYDDQFFQKRFLSEYFDKYNAVFYFYDQQGKVINSNRKENFAKTRAIYNQKNFETDYPAVFRLKDGSFGSNLTYATVVSLNKGDKLMGHVIVELTQQDLNENSVFPLLLMHEKKQGTNYNPALFSFADYYYDQLQYQSGEFNYSKFFDLKLLRNHQLYKNGLLVNGFRHFGIREKENRVRIVSHKVYGLYDLYTDFAYIFLIMILLASMVVVSYGFYLLSRNVKLNFVAKIQIYLNSAFLVPLLALSVTTLSMMINTSRRAVISSYTTKSEGIVNNMNEVMVAYEDRLLDKADVVYEVDKIANISSLDIALYDVNGKLIASNQPMVFQRQLLSNRINPKALRALSYEGDQKVVLDEYAGDYEYKQVYVSLRSQNSGRLIGIIGVPFFPVNPTTDPLLNEGVNNIINLFTFIFIIFLAIAFFASRWLTYPLVILAQRIRSTNLSSLDQPLKWRSDDEIGSLVKEYNRMLKKLEESKIKMAQAEKQSAWREMAQQVAHEIKNPLTPMKLRLQYMQMVMNNSDSEEMQRNSETIDMLLGQVDLLSEIATSFSEFAKMPMPIKEPFDFTDELNKVIELYREPERGVLIFPEVNGSIWVEGDHQLINRTLSNLIINGFQAVSSDVEPRIEIGLEEEEDQIKVSIKDNGIGIAEDIQSKVFLPNFSTKFSGSGIGLAVAKRGIEHAGGKIWFDSEVGKGTTFYVSLMRVK
ncbi:HAMP domain-containing sensor histidine kinase [Persicobacter sp. CCB-QB2]|uniref:sensor histidine kinase n=1 Tax=Persicobacter sp. CCB-QB2 TaxID=1561025 RepID=UPI000ABEB9F3|nr:HAMP domain-containing sensor histidine kinase [Persicobacter sp. CCB-QB2]